MPKFIIEQIALHPRDPDAARQLLADMGCDDWTIDRVTAFGSVRGHAASNDADLSFNYQANHHQAHDTELEILSYHSGVSWISGQNRVSHLGMHCTEEELLEWRGFFSRRQIKVAQEVVTTSHTNPNIRNSRRYHYVIFDTHDILSVDIKFIVRKDVPA